MLNIKSKMVVVSRLDPDQLTRFGPVNRATFGAFVACLFFFFGDASVLARTMTASRDLN